MEMRRGTATDICKGAIPLEPTEPLTRPSQKASINFEDCTEVRETLLELGEEHNGWWTTKEKKCQSWKNGSCKATFCPQIHPRDGLDVYMPDLALKQFFFVGAMCATKGQRGIIVPANASYSLHVSEAEW